MYIVNATKMKNNFGRYLKYAKENEVVYIEKHGKITAKLISVDQEKKYLSQSLKRAKENADESVVY